MMILAFLLVLCVPGYAADHQVWNGGGEVYVLEDDTPTALVLVDNVGIAPLASITSSYGVGTSNINIFGPIASKLPYGVSYVYWRDGQYTYRLAYSNGLELAGRRFTADEVTVITYQTNLGSNTQPSFTTTTEQNFSLSAGNYLVWSDLGNYPTLYERGGEDYAKTACVTEGLFTIQLMVNGKLVGSSVSGTRLRLSNYELDLSKLGNIYSIGARLSIVQGDTISNGSTIKDAMGGFYVLDSLSVVADEKGDSGSEETNGLLNTILGWLKSIFDGINNIAIAIVELPGKIVNAIIDGLKSLFVPSEEDLAAIQEQYKTLLSERLGFVWQAGELVIDFGSSVLSALEGATDYSFHFPGVHLSLPEGEYDLIAAQDVSLDNPLTAVLRPVLGTIVSFLVVAAFVNTAERMVVAFVSGKSYFDFLKGDGEE